MEGDSRFTVLYFLGLQFTLGGGTYMLISAAVKEYLSGVAMI
jgi:hypothetical protein